MPIESLWLASKSPFTHRAGHDLESFLSTIITICNYTTGPGGQLRVPMAGDEDMLMNSWFTKEQRRQLACLKSAHLEAFNESIQPDLPKYWADFAPFLCRLVEVTWAAKPFSTKPNTATHQAYRAILLEALNMYNKTENALHAPYAVVPAPKRLREGRNAEASNKRQRKDDKPPLVRERSPRPHYLQSYHESEELEEASPNLN